MKEPVQPLPLAAASSSTELSLSGNLPCDQAQSGTEGLALPTKQAFILGAGQPDGAQAIGTKGKAPSDLHPGECAPVGKRRLSPRP